MDEIGKIVNQAANFYNTSLLGIDIKLSEFGFRTLLPFFRGKVGLELGPASGYMTKRLVNEFETLHLVEGSKMLLDEIPDFPNVTKFHSLFEDYESNIQYDTIIMSHVLEHISDPISILTKISKWLKKGGVLCVSVPNAKSLHRLVASEMGLIADEYVLNQRDIELGHYRVYDSALLIDHIQKAGFEVIENGGYFLKPVSNGQIESYWTSEMIDGFFKVGKHFQDNCAEIFVVCTR